MNNTQPPQFSVENVQHMLDQVEGWYVKTNKEIKKEFTFATFAEARAFINRVGEIAEKEGSYPEILLYQGNKVRISLSTQSSGGLAEKDFED